MTGATDLPAAAASGVAWTDWYVDPVTWPLLLVAVGLYEGGWRRLGDRRARRRVRDDGAGAARGRALRAWRVRRWAFLAGAAVVVLAVASPLDALAARLLSAHMVQHLLLVLVAAPLLAASRPQIVAVAALPARVRRLLRRPRGWLTGMDDRRAVPRGLIAATALHLVLLLTWHAPALYDLALRDPVAHGVEHACFLASATLVWIWLLRPGARSHMAYGTAVLCIAVLMLLGGALGAQLAFAETTRYAHYAGTTTWGRSALEDQHLAGVTMWIPAGIFYGTVAVVLFVRWFAAVEASAGGGRRAACTAVYPHTVAIPYPARRRRARPAAATMTTDLSTPARTGGGRWSKEHHMPLVIVLIILGLVLGGVSFVVETLAWLLVVGIALVIVGAVLGARAMRGR